MHVEPLLSISPSPFGCTFYDQPSTYEHDVAAMHALRLKWNANFCKKQACQHAGVVRDDKLLLVPVDNALQLRPSLAHLDKPAAAAGAPAAGVAEAAEEEDVKAELQAVKVRRHGC
jgi:hypothetical protein